jgi:hypothetical protein
MNTSHTFYICPICFTVCDEWRECHDRPMILCDAGEPGDERRKPLRDNTGRLISHAPRWFLEAVGWLPGR